jgi:hypothetical protein
VLAGARAASAECGPVIAPLPGAAAGFIGAVGEDASDSGEYGSDQKDKSDDDDHGDP